MIRPRATHADAALRAWGDALRRDAGQRRRRRRLLLATGLGAVLCLGTLGIRPTPRLVWNASASAPIGLYGVTPVATPVRGDLVIARAPGSMRTLAARRGYLPHGVPLIKRVVAVPGDTLCALGPHLFRDGEPLVDRRPRDAAGRPMPWWNGCIRVTSGQVLLVMANVPTSFDGRYFGPSDARDILGVAHPLWLR
jgi:conjugative transfer signal peptidase TraF